MMKTIKTYWNDYKEWCDEAKTIRDKHRKGYMLWNALVFIVMTIWILGYYTILNQNNYEMTYETLKETEEES